MKTVILAGGQGTRLAEQTEVMPKPMVTIGGAPILWHIMKIYRVYGFREFALALGYKADVIKNYFLNYHSMQHDFSIDVGTGEIRVTEGEREDWLVHLVDTGISTETGGRLKRLAPHLDDGTFMMTYGDGVADVDLEALLAFHRESGMLATMTAVRPGARFGAVRFVDGLVTKFDEKPQTGEGWINGGFFVLEPDVLDYIADDETIFEREPLERLAADGQLGAYRHDGFWQCMDTLRDVRMLDGLWKGGDPPWAVWNRMAKPS